ncbi:MAG: phosphoenolpyruvate--protein phosphotransferase [Myxococcota bacterium]
MTAPERRGSGASPGIAIGPAYVLRRERLVIPEYRIEPERVEAEIQRLEAAFAEARRDLDGIRRQMQSTGLVGDVFDAQFLFLEDPTLLESGRSQIRDSRVNAEWALQREGQQLEAMFRAVSDPYIRERSSDVRFILRRVLRALLGREPEGLGNAPEGVIVVAEDLSPAEMVQVSHGRIAAVVTASGSQTSHVMIIARSLQLPAVVGAGSGLVAAVTDGCRLIVDGRLGRVLIDPDDSLVASYEQKQSELETYKSGLLRYAKLPAETHDGVEVGLMANVDLIEEIPVALRHGAEGIGLYRTEFLFLNRSSLPSEDEQEAAYREILEAVAPRPAVIRTLDLGGDKAPGVMDLQPEANPALGLRGVRLSLKRPEFFRTQLRAMLRASHHGRLRILLPMISQLGELEFAREQVEKAAEEVGLSGLGEVELGVMIETPAAALIADLITPRVDFLSIGTNDLLQYSLAVDRGNPQVSYLYEPLHPSHLRLIEQVSRAARTAGIRLGMCGEMAGDPAHAWILLALGVGELSMTAFAIPLLKKILRDSTLAEARELLTEVRRCGTAAESRARVEAVMARRFPAEFDHIAAGP